MINWELAEKKAIQQAKKAGTYGTNSDKVATKNRTANLPKKEKKEKPPIRAKSFDKTVTTPNGKKVSAGGRRKVDSETRDIINEFLTPTSTAKPAKFNGKNLTMPNGKVVNAGGRRKIDAETRDILNKAQAEYAVPKFLANMTEGMAQNSVPGTLHTLITGEKPDILGGNPYADEVRSGFAAKAGNLAGTGAAFMTQSTFFAPAAAKIAGTAAKTKVGQAVAERAINSKIGQLIGEETVRNVGRGLAENAVDALTVGTMQNVGMNYGSGLRGGDLVKQTLKDTAFDLGFGTVVQGAPAVGKAVGAKKALKVDAPKVDAPKVEPIETPKTEPVTGRVTEPTETDFVSENPIPENYKKTYPVRDVRTLPKKDIETPDKYKLRKIRKSLKEKIGVDKFDDNRYVDGELSDIIDKAKQGTLTDDDIGEFATTLLDEGTYVEDVYEPAKELQAAIRGYKIKTDDAFKHGISDWNYFKKRNFGNFIISNYGTPIEDVYADLQYLFPGMLPDIDTKTDMLIALADFANRHKGGPRETRYVDTLVDATADDLLDIYNDTKRIIRESLNEYLGPTQTHMKTKLKPPVKKKPPVTKVVKENIPNADIPNAKVVKDNIPNENLGIVNKDVEELTQKSKKFGEKAYKNLVSGQKEIEKMAKVAGSTKVNDYTQGVRARKGTIDYIVGEKLVDRAGKVVNDKSYKKLIDEIPKKDRELFNEYAQHLHNIDRVNQGKPVFKDVTAEQSKDIVDGILKNHPEFTKMTQSLNKWWDDFAQAYLIDSGIMTKAQYEDMRKMYPNYIPTYRVDKAFPGNSVHGTKISTGNVLKKAKGGSSEVANLEDNFLKQIDRIVSSAKKNDLYLSILEEFEKQPDLLKQFGVLSDDITTIKGNGLDAFLDSVDQGKLKEVKSGVYTLSAIRDGKKITAHINKDMADALRLLDDAYDSSEGARFFASIGKKITNPVKEFVTTLNPVFIISNMSRDFPTLFIQSKHGMGKTTTGVFKALKSMLTNDDFYQMYKGLGGKQGGYYVQGRGFSDIAGEAKGIKGVYQGMTSILSRLGEGAETIPRLTEFINSVEKYGATQDGLMRALNDAADVTVNFSRSAPVTKTLDGWVLYLNAAVQGLDKFGRALKDAPLKTIGRSATVITIPYVLTMAANWNNPHYHDLNERTKQNYFVIPNVTGEKDEQGNCKTFIKLPLNREYGALCGSSFEVMLGLMSGQSWEEATKGYGETLKNNFMPPSDPVISPITKNLPSNKDFAGRAIVPYGLENAPPELQQDATTSGAAKAVSKVASTIEKKMKLPMPDTIKSPKKVDYLIDSYGGYFGQVLQAATAKDSKDIKSLTQNTLVEPFTQRFSADPRYSSGVVADFYDNKEKVEQAQTADKLNNKVTENSAKLKVYNKISTQLSDLTKQEKEILESNLSKEQKNTQIKAIREKKNAIAKTAEKEAEKAVKEFRQSPTFSKLPTKVKDKYESNGMSKEKWAKAYEAQKDYNHHTDKVIAMLKSGVKTYEQANSIANINENAYRKGVNLYNQGITPEEIRKAYVEANTDGKGLKKVEITTYLDNTNYSREEKRAIFAALCNYNNPY